MATKALGRGLSALISENYVKPEPKSTKAAKPEAPVKAEKGSMSMLPVGKLHAGKYQPRTEFDDTALEELSKSIKKNGVMQPVLVRASEKHAGKYEIIAGERRWRASRLAGLSEIPVLIRDINDQQALEMALIENIQRQDLSPIEEALGYERLIDEFSYTQEKLAGTIGKSRSHIANTIRLLALPDEVKKMISEGKLTAGHARTLLTAPDPLALARQIVAGGFNVREAEDISRKAKGVEKKPSSEPKPRAVNAPALRRDESQPKDPDIVALEDSLSENLGVRVAIYDRGPAGDIVLSYDSLSQLDEILKRLSNSI